MAACGQLGLAFSPSLNKNSTHLISASVLGPKYVVAVRNHVPVLRPDWILTSAERGQLEPEAPYLLRPLHGLRVAVTGQVFDVVVRERISDLVGQLGGELMAGLSETCNYLIAASVHTEKFHACCSGAHPELSKVKIVSCGFLEACLRSGTRVHEGPYLMARPEPCLSACVIAVAPRSASDAQKAQLRHAACCTGASRADRLGRSVTHILFGDAACDDPGSWVADANALAASAPGAQLVTAEWLLRCETSGQREPVEPFLWRRFAGSGSTAQTAHHHQNPLNAPPFHHAPPVAQPPSAPPPAASAHHPHFSHHPSVGGASHQPHVSTQPPPPTHPSSSRAAGKQSMRDTSRGQHMAAAAAASSSSAAATGPDAASRPRDRAAERGGGGGGGGGGVRGGEGRGRGGEGRDCSGGEGREGRERERGGGGGGAAAAAAAAAAKAVAPRPRAVRTSRRPRLRAAATTRAGACCRC